MRFFFFFLFIADVEGSGLGKDIFLKQLAGDRCRNIQKSLEGFSERESCRSLLEERRDNLRKRTN